ncbi:MAG: DoxX family protein [Woeseiaceae bacterium]|nr:DoxX family protein [Woeseiaceae bacterium]
MQKLTAIWERITGFLNPAGEWIGLLPIRLLMAWEFGSAGLKKLGASDTIWGDVPQWFVNSLEKFPFPVNLFPASFNWFMVTWIEILGGFALALGLFTRFWAFSLIVVTWVAILGVHWPQDYSSLAELWKGYAVTNEGFGNYRIPLLFMAMLVPLVLRRPDKLSIDHLLSKQLGK